MILGYAFMSGVDCQISVAEAMRQTGINEADSPAVCALASRLVIILRNNRSTDDSRANFEAATFNADGLSYASHLVEAKRALLQSMVIQAWTAFEVLAEDLWKEVTAKRPELIAGITKAEWKKCGFKSAPKIANAYRYTFRPDNSGNIAWIVDHTVIKALAVARNVLVHSGGRIDEMFTKQRAIIPELNSIRGRKKGYLIPFTGSLVRRLVDPTTVLGFGLVRTVDEWLSANPHKQPRRIFRESRHR